LTINQHQFTGNQILKHGTGEIANQSWSVQGEKLVQSLAMTCLHDGDFKRMGIRFIEITIFGNQLEHTAIFNGIGAKRGCVWRLESRQTQKKTARRRHSGKDMIDALGDHVLVGAIGDGNLLHQKTLGRIHHFPFPKR